MAEKRDDGGPAFPSEFLAKIPYSQEALEQLHESGAQCESHAMVQSAGMSLRDYFAGQAIGIVIQQADLQRKLAWPEFCASCCAAAYEVADAMLAERSK